MTQKLTLPTGDKLPEGNPDPVGGWMPLQSSAHTRIALKEVLMPTRPNLPNKKYQIFTGGQRWGRSAAAIKSVKRTPGKKLLVRNLTELDKYIKAGLQPSQVLLPRELSNNSIIKIGGGQ